MFNIVIKFIFGIILCPTLCFAGITQLISDIDRDGYHIIHEKTEKTLTAPVSPCSLFGRGYVSLPGNSGEEINSCWLLSSWGQCSNGCGEGVMIKDAQCVDLGGNVSNLCSLSLIPKFEVQCTDYSRCDYSWNSSNWSECSNACGFGVKTRSVWCQDAAGNGVENIFCSTENKPATSFECSDYSECGYTWSYGEWGTCESESYEGQITRDAVCVNYLNQTVSDNLCTDEKDNSKPCEEESLQSFNSCFEAYSQGKSIDGHYKIKGYKTYCDMTGGGWTLIAKAGSGNTEFRYDGIAWDNQHFGVVDGTGSYLSPLWSELSTSEIKLSFIGGSNYQFTARTSLNAPFSSLRTTNTLYSTTFDKTDGYFKQGSSKVGCTWAQTTVFRFAIYRWMGNCNYAIDFHGLGIKHPSFQTGSGDVQDGAPANDKVIHSGFKLFVK